MKSLATKKLLTFLITALFVINPLSLHAAEDSAGSPFDESLQDLTTVMGAGAVGALLGLSTLSFVETPKDHFKNIAIGGAIGIVVGVGIVVFGQATKTQSSMGNVSKLEMTSDTVASLARLDFSKQKIAENYLLPTTVGYSFSF